jgi:hypothetical protein
VSPPPPPPPPRGVHTRQVHMISRALIQVRSFL